jgi:predicted RNA binding protein YcfA (HicA-like mRNA interferase family)
MPKLPILTAVKFIKAIKKDGFTLDRSRGSHQTFLNPNKPNATVVIPVHPGHDLGKGLTKSLIKDAGLTEADFINLL